MKNTVLLILAFFCLTAPSLADDPPLQVAISVTNGAVDASPSLPEGMPADDAIRVFVSLENRSRGRLTVSRIACTFFDGEGHEVGQDQAQPLELRSREKGNAVLFYSNPSALFAFKAVGVIEYQQDGKTFSTPINVDQNSLAQPYQKNGVNY